MGMLDKLMGGEEGLKGLQETAGRLEKILERLAVAAEAIAEGVEEYNHVAKQAMGILETAAEAPAAGEVKKEEAN